MNYWYFTAALGCAFGFLVHIFLGNKRIDNVIFASNIHIDVRTLSRIVWHSVTLLLGISAIALMKGAIYGIDREFAFFISAYLFGFSALFLYFQAVHLGNPVKYPHPIVFALVGGLVLRGGLW